MIRLCEGKLKEINLNNFTSDSLISYIESEKLTNYVFSFTFNEKYIGDFVWDDILSFKNFNELTQAKRIYCGEDIFHEIRSYWKQNRSGIRGRHLYVPIYDEHDKFFCVAFDDAYEKGEHHNDKNCANYFKIANEYQNISLTEIFPNIKMYYLHNVNEIQYILYQYLKKYNVPYMLVGEQWKILGMDTYLQEKNKRILKCDDSETCNIFADDETVRSINDMRYYYREDYLFEKYHELSTRLALCNYINEVEIVSKYLNRYGVATACVRFPDAAELGQTENEAWCFHNQVSLNFFRKQCDFKYIHNILETYGEKLVGQYKRGVTQVGRFMEVVNECNLQYVNDEKRNKIILVGPCVVRQEELMTEDTLVSRLQSKMDEAGYPYRVEGLTIPIEKYHRMKSALQTMYFYKGDIVIFCNMYLEQEFANYYLDLLPLFQSNRGERWFTDTSIHLNQIGTERVAERIADLVSNINGENICNNTITLYPKKISLEKEQWINSWVKQWKNNELNMNGATIGAIVMNCNPYTKGHDYLIRYAASHVDFLYIFVVEEDVSLFSFDIRYELVRKNTADLNNVGVIPSGKAVLSMQTLPTYFSKGSVCDVTVDASNDLTTFAIGIAPRFGITKRFVGTEPNDSVTAQYNEQMKQILQHYGIEVVEIPRLEIGGEVISATTARNAMKDGNINILQKMLTDISFSEIMRES